MLFETGTKPSRTQPSEARPRFMQQSGSSEARWVYRGSHLRSGGPCGSHLAPSGSLRVPSTGAAGATERCSLGVSGDAFTMSWTERGAVRVCADAAGTIDRVGFSKRQETRCATKRGPPALPR
jgi:hypothetical protein